MHCLPNHTQNELLKAVLNPDRSAGYQELINWINATDFDGVVPKSEFNLLPGIWHKYKEQLTGNPLEERFGGLYRKSFYTTSRLLHQVVAIVDILEREQLKYAFANGIALHLLLGEASGSRPMNSMDILVEQADFIPAVEAIRQIGYYPAHPGKTMDVYTTGQVHVCKLSHSTLYDINVYCYPTPLHNQKLTNQVFLQDVYTHTLNATSIRLLTPENLSLFLLTTYQFSDEWHWVSDVVLLDRLYGLSFHKLRTIVQQTGLYRTTYRQLNFLFQEFDVGAFGELAFYSNQPRLLTDRYVSESTSLHDIKRRTAMIINFNGFNDKEHVDFQVVVKLAQWYYRKVRKTAPRVLLSKIGKFLR